MTAMEVKTGSEIWLNTQRNLQNIPYTFHVFDEQYRRSKH